MATKKTKKIVASADSAITVQHTLDDLVNIIKSCEQSVVSNWQTMALAVKDIHSKQLWAANYESFEHCMAEAVGWKKSWAYEMLKAADVLEDAPITDASMARYLHPLDAQKRMLAWSGAVNEASPEKPTRDDVKRAASMLKGEVTSATTEDVADEESGAPDKQQEAAPSLVPDSAEFERIVAMLREARNAIEELAEKPAGAYIGTAQIVVDLKNVFNALQWAKPHAVCVYCEGDGCKHCQSRGWLCKGLHASAPEDLK
jgi:hypothetical protein